MVREPVVAGQFYPGARKGLESAVAKLMGEIPERKAALGAISPHAGYIYSGAVAAATLRLIKPAGCYIIIGPNHTGMGAPYSVFPRGRWVTPLGEAEVDEELAGNLIAGSRYLKGDVMAHAREHSIEVQLPFLQYLSQEFKFVPIVAQMSSARVLKDIGAEIARSLRSLKRSAVIIASSDMTHYEPQKSAEAKDKKALEAVMKLDEELLIKDVSENDISMCGIAPAVIMLSAVKAMGATRAELVKYQTSGDASGDYSSVVGYAGVLIT